MAQLEPEQAQLLSALCEAQRSQDRSNRRTFVAYKTGGEGSFVKHPKLPGGSITDLHYPDLEILASYGLVLPSPKSDATHMQFDVTPEGFEHWEQIKAAQGSAVERVEEEVRSYLDAAAFRSRFGEAFDKWAQAEAHLWAADSAAQFTTIGHECREAIQMFGAAFANAAGAEANDNPALNVDNLRRGLDAMRGRVSETASAMLDALLAYWGTVTDLVQRQEHGAAKEGEPVGWEDARAVVFQTANVMFECARALDRAKEPRR